MKRLIAFAVLLFSQWAHASDLPPAFRAESLNLRQVVPAPTLTALNRLRDPDVILPALVEHMDVSTADIRGPARAGLVRGFKDYRSTRDGLIVRSVGAKRMRLHLENVKLSSTDVLQVYGEAGDVVVFGSELIGPSGDLWTPSVAGDTIGIDTFGIEVTITSVAHIDVPIATSVSCFQDVTCASFLIATRYQNQSLSSRSSAEQTWVVYGRIDQCEGSRFIVAYGESLHIHAS